MSTIRRLREARNTSLEELAAKIRVAPAALADWEKGAAQPSPSELRSLAFAFGCRSEDLQGEREENGPKILTNTYYILTDRKIEDGWWGHFGVRLPGCAQSKWYPITLGTANLVSAQLRNYEEGEQWIIVETLNNRKLVINPLATSRLWLLDDAQDNPSDDWSIPIDGYEGQPAELYKALEEYPDNPQREELDLSDYVTEYIEEFTDVNDFGDEEIYRLIFYTHIHDRSGACTSYWVNAPNLVELLESIELGAPAQIIDMSCDDFDSYFPSSSISMIDMPRMLVLQETDGPASKSEEDQS